MYKTPPPPSFSNYLNSFVFLFNNIAKLKKHLKPQMSKSHKTRRKLQSYSYGQAPLLPKFKNQTGLLKYWSQEPELRQWGCGGGCLIYGIAFWLSHLWKYYRHSPPKVKRWALSFHTNEMAASPNSRIQNRSAGPYNAADNTLLGGSTRRCKAATPTQFISNNSFPS